MDLMQRRRQIMAAASPLVEMTATGNPAVFTTKARKAYTELKAGFLPVQDLHGYEYPWPAGGGKNKFNTDFSDTTINDTAIAKLSDGKVSTSGVPTSAFDFVVGTVTLPAGDYILNGCPAGGGANKYRLQVTDFPVRSNLGQDSGSGVSFTLSEEMIVAVRIQVYTGASDSLTFAPMIRLASETDATFAPYTNICPITGWDGVQISRTGKNLLTTADWMVTSDSITKIDNNSMRVLQQSYQESYNRYVFGKARPKTFSFKVLTESIDGNAWFKFYLRDSTGSTIREIQVYLRSVDYEQTVTTTISDNAAEISLGGWAYSGGVLLSDMQMEFSETATAYEPYTGNTYSIAFPSEAGTVYGGTLDAVTGVLTVDRIEWTAPRTDWQTYTHTSGKTIKYYNLSSETIDVIPNAVANRFYSVSDTFAYYTNTANWYSEMPEYQYVYNVSGVSGNKRVWICYEGDDFEDVVEGAKFIFMLQNPVTYTLTAQQIQALLGTNTVFSDANDDIEVKYLTRN